MRFSSFVLAASKSVPRAAQTPRSDPQAPFRRTGNTFDALFVTPKQRKKAWEGQDKDAFFRDKYAHVHAKQLKIKKAEQEAAAKRRAQRVPAPKPAATPVMKPRRNFAERHQDQLERDHSIEFIYGTNAVKAVIQKRQVQKLYTGYKSLGEVDAEIATYCLENHIPVEANVPVQHLNIMSRNGVHNKYVVQTKKKDLITAQTLAVSSNELLVNDSYEHRIAYPHHRLPTPVGIYLDQITDTHNMGAILRSALWFGADFVAYSPRNSATISPAVVKASSGASEFLDIIEVPHPLRFFDKLRDDKWAIIATAPNQSLLKSHDIDLTTLQPEELRERLSELQRPALLVIGSEGDGVRTTLLQRSTHSTTLVSQQTDVDSLNVSVATALLLSNAL